jgi:ABC-type sugar transport system ATPase subunit
VATTRTGETDVDRVVAQMTGKELSELTVERAESIGETVLQVEHLSVEHPELPGRKILSDVSLHVRAGEVLALAGAMGAGRTALLSTLFGLAPGRVSGRISVDGDEVAVRSPAQAVARGIALVPEDRKECGLVLGMSVAENLTLAALSRITPAGLVDPVREERVAARHVEDLHIKTASLTGEVATLSGGNQQKVVIGKWLLTEPRILLLDEPTRGVDVGAKAEIYRLIRRLTGDGKAVVMASSDLPEVLLLSDRVLVLREGRVAGALSREETTQEAILRLAIG